MFQINKSRSGSANNLSSTLVSATSSHDLNGMDASDAGPKTRGASKRRNIDSGGGGGKKTKRFFPCHRDAVFSSTADFNSTKIAGQDAPIDFPFNREGYRYYLVEKDPNVPERFFFLLT